MIYRHYLIDYRDVFVPKIGVQRVFFLRKVMRDISRNYILKQEKERTCLVSNMLK
ncbi:MAG: hypothetical protein ACTSVK_17660 [Promethearchaeota archaeon]